MYSVNYVPYDEGQTAAGLPSNNLDANASIWYRDISICFPQETNTFNFSDILNIENGGLQMFMDRKQLSSSSLICSLISVLISAWVYLVNNVQYDYCWKAWPILDGQWKASNIWGLLQILSPVFWSLYIILPTVFMILSAYDKNPEAVVVFTCPIYALLKI